MERLGADDFVGATLQRPGRYAVLFTADWCPFCRAFLGPFARLEAAAGFEVAKVDLTDLESPFWDRFAVEVVPTVLVFRDGKVVFRVDGVAGEGLGGADLQHVRAAATG